MTHTSHTVKTGCALALGEGDTGQLGLGPDILDRTKPAKVPDLPNNVIQVYAGGMHTVCLTAEGHVSENLINKYMKFISQAPPASASTPRINKFLFNFQYLQLKIAYTSSVVCWIWPSFCFFWLAVDFWCTNWFAAHNNSWNFPKSSRMHHFYISKGIKKIKAKSRPPTSLGLRNI